MPASTLRQIAEKARLSVATVSRVLHQDPSVRPDTARRVHDLIEREGYGLDPVVSAAMSKIRRRDFYRETIAWCSDVRHGEMPWLNDLYDSAEQFGSKIGYKIEHFHFDNPSAGTLKRLVSVWIARGIRGVLLGPMQRQYRQLPFPWETPALAWITIGSTFNHPSLHKVSRDYRSDLELGMQWLAENGSKRPCFLLEPRTRFFFRQDILDAALRFQYEQGEVGSELPYYELDRTRPSEFESWLERHQPDGLVLAAGLPRFQAKRIRALKSLPTVLLSPPGRPPGPHELHFSARYEVLGPVAINTLHRLLRNRETGILPYRHRVLVNSHHRTSAIAADRSKA